MKIGVVIPACNEEDHLAQCLGALQRAVSVLSNDHDIEVVVVLDSCDDGSLEIIRKAQGELKLKIHYLECQYRCVGLTRDLGVRYCIAEGMDWISCTDADSEVTEQWLVQQMACQPMDLICGVVEVAHWHGIAEDVQQKYHAHYQDRMGHSHIHGANLSFNAETYICSDGFAALCSHEDVDLVMKVQALGRRILWTNQVRVLTSSRLNAKAPQGFSYFLRALNTESAALQDLES